jgi:hypothetical protein
MLLLLLTSAAMCTGSEGRKVSRAGFDISPLTPEQKAAEAGQLTDFQR